MKSFEIIKRLINELFFTSIDVPSRCRNEHSRYFCIMVKRMREEKEKLKGKSRTNEGKLISQMLLQCI
jgi:hypothetical protein